MIKNEYNIFIFFVVLEALFTTSAFSQQIYPDWQIAYHQCETDLPA